MTMNKEQVDALFRREAVLLGGGDVVPAFRSAVLFGEKPVRFALSHPAGDYWNIYGTGDHDLTYLTLRGFRAAASYRNALKLQEEEAQATE